MQDVHTTPKNPINHSINAFEGFPELNSLNPEERERFNTVYGKIIERHLLNLFTNRKDIPHEEPKKEPKKFNEEEESDCYLEEEVELVSNARSVGNFPKEKAQKRGRKDHWKNGSSDAIDVFGEFDEHFLSSEEHYLLSSDDEEFLLSSEEREDIDDEEPEKELEDEDEEELKEELRQLGEPKKLTHSNRTRSAPKSIYTPADSFKEAIREEREAEKTARDIGHGKFKYDLIAALNILRTQGMDAFCRDKWVRSMFPFLAIQTQCGLEGNGASEHFRQLYTYPHHFRVVVTSSEARCCYLCGLSRVYTSGVVDSRTGTIHPMGGFCAALAVSVIDLANDLIKASRNPPKSYEGWQELWRTLHKESTTMQQAHANKTNARAPKKGPKAGVSDMKPKQVKLPNRRSGKRQKKCI